MTDAKGKKRCKNTGRLRKNSLIRPMRGAYREDVTRSGRKCREEAGDGKVRA